MVRTIVQQTTFKGNCKETVSSSVNKQFYGSILIAKLRCSWGYPMNGALEDLPTAGVHFEAMRIWGLERENWKQHC